MIKIESQDGEVLDYLNRLARQMYDMRPVMADIGEYGVESTKRRFDKSTGPDGQRWEPNTEATLLHYLASFSGSYTKGGKLSSKGSARIIGKKPLIGESRSLMSTIYYQVVGGNAVEWGSPMEYSAMQHFGGLKSQFPHLWGDIFPRPFLGINAADEAAILDIVATYLAP